MLCDKISPTADPCSWLSNNLLMSKTQQEVVAPRLQVHEPQCRQQPAAYIDRALKARKAEAREAARRGVAQKGVVGVGGVEARGGRVSGLDQVGGLQ